VGRAVELSDVHDVILVLQYGGLIVIYVEIVWGAEDRHNAGKTGSPRLAVHSVTSILGLMCPNDGK